MHCTSRQLEKRCSCPAVPTFPEQGSGLHISFISSTWHWASHWGCTYLSGEERTIVGSPLLRVCMSFASSPSKGQWWLPGFLTHAGWGWLDLSIPWDASQKPPCPVPTPPSLQPGLAGPRAASMRVGPSGHTRGRDSALAGGALLQAARGQSRAIAPHLQAAQHPRPLLLGWGGGEGGPDCCQAGWARGRCGWLSVAGRPRTASAR